MNNYLLLVACFLLGILLRRSGRLPDNAAAALNGFVIHISLPALTLTYVHGLKLQTSLILPAMMPWLMFGIGCGFFWLAGRGFGFSRANDRWADADRRTGKHVIHWATDDRDVLWPAVSRPRNIDRPVGLVFRAQYPWYPSSLALLLRPRDQCEGSDPKNRPVRAVPGVHFGVPANAVRIPCLARRICSSAWALPWSRLLSYRSATSCSSATYGARCSRWSSDLCSSWSSVLQ